MPPQSVSRHTARAMLTPGHQTYQAVLDIVSDSFLPAGQGEALVIPVPSEQELSTADAEIPTHRSVWLPVAAVRYILLEMENRRRTEDELYRAAMSAPDPADTPDGTGPGRPDRPV